jgi:hypothetical protein
MGDVALYFDHELSFASSGIGATRGERRRMLSGASARLRRCASVA